MSDKTIDRCPAYRVGQGHCQKDWEHQGECQFPFSPSPIYTQAELESAADALADREAAIHHSYQCGEAYGRLVSAQVDLIVAERMQEAVQPFAEALEALVGKVAESSRRSQVMWLPDIGEVWKARDLLAAHRAAVGAQEKK